MRSLCLMILKVLVLSVLIMLCAQKAFPDVGCIDVCSQQLAGCANGGAGGANCEDDYDACVERCIGFQF